MDKNMLRQHLLDNASEFVNETMIDMIMEWLRNTGLPEIKSFASEYIHALNKYGENETGWNKFRDQVFLPLIIGGALWLAENATNRVLKETKAKANV